MTDLRPYLRAVLAGTKLTVGDRLVVLVLATYANETGHAWPSSATMSDACGMHPASIRKCTKRLVTAGVIHADVRPGRSTVYRFPAHPSTTCSPPATGNGEGTCSPPATTRQGHLQPTGSPPVAHGLTTCSPRATHKDHVSTKEEERARGDAVDNYGDRAVASRMRQILDAAYNETRAAR